MCLNKNEISIRLLNHKEFNELHDFIKKQWSEFHILSYNTELLDWQHKAKNYYNCVAAFKSGKIVGLHCVIPMNQFDDNLPLNQIFLSLWRAIEGVGVSIGFRMYNYVLKEYKPDFIGSVGITRKVFDSGFHRRLGYKIGTMDHSVIISPFVNDFNIAYIPDLKPIRKNQGAATSYKSAFVRISKDELYDFKSKHLYLYQTPIKSDIYIYNRYFNHPIYKYHVYALISKDNNLIALCVIRPIHVNNSVVLRFVDYIGSSQSFPQLYNHLICILKEYKAEYIDLYSYGLPLEVLKESKFLNIKEIKGLIIPNHFEPFERKNIDIKYAYKNLIGGQTVRLFKADADQDRPNC